MNVFYVRQQRLLLLKYKHKRQSLNITKEEELKLKKTSGTMGLLSLRKIFFMIFQHNASYRQRMAIYLTDENVSHLSRRKNIFMQVREEEDGCCPDRPECGYCLGVVLEIS